MQTFFSFIFLCNIQIKIDEMVDMPLLNSTAAFRSKVYIVLFSFFDFVFVDEGNKRGATWKMLKNQGLKAHKKRVDRNPRVKKRKQYEKAKKNRKGAVREMRTKEIGKYQGETTGIRTTITRSRRLG